MTLKLELIGSLSAAMILCGAWRICAATYNVSERRLLFVNGTITTDGNTGVLASIDIQSWSLTITGFGSPILLNTSNSVLNYSNAGLTATAASLSFNFSGSSAVALDFAGTSGSFVQWADAADVGTLAGLGIAAGNISGPPGSFLDGISHRSGTEEIAEADGPISSTPIPATLPLFAIGLGGLGLIGLIAKRGKQKQSSALAAA